MAAMTENDTREIFSLLGRVFGCEHRKSTAHLALGSWRGGVGVQRILVRGMIGS